MKLSSFFGVIFLCTPLLTSVALGDENDSLTIKPSSPEMANVLRDSKYGILSVENLLTQSIITGAQADQANTYFVERASKAAGRNLSYQELVDYKDVNLGPDVELTALQRFAGLITFINILWVLAISIGIICFLYLTRHWIISLLELFRSIPIIVYEVLLVLGGVAITTSGILTTSGSGIFQAFTGVLMFSGGFWVIYANHDSWRKNGETINFIIGFLAATPVAILCHSELIGFLAVIQLMAALGFSAAVIPCGYVIGFKDESALGRATVTGFGLLIVYVVWQALGQGNEAIEVFKSGALFMGSFIGYLGLLSASSRWYRYRVNYVLFQIITIVAGLAAIFVGSLLSIGELQKIGGTFFVLYLIEKLFEVPTRSRITYAYIGLLASGILYGICWLASNYSEIFRPYLLF